MEKEKKAIPGTTASKAPPKIPLFTHLGLETVSSLISASIISPFISIIDRAIFLNASGKEPLGKGVSSGFSQLIRTPTIFVRQPSFLIVWGIYSATYLTANYTQTICDHLMVPWFYPKFIATSSVNVTLSLLKDIYFTRAFGVGSIPRRVPTATYFLYSIRDSMTIFASFNLPGVIETRLHNLKIPESTASNIGQLSAPLLAQIFSTPLHLYGMDLYNRDGKITSAQRLGFIKREYFGTTLARWGRILPAYSIGGVLNNTIRTRGKKFLEEYYAKFPLSDIK